MRFRAREEDFEDAHSFVEGLLSRKDVNDEIVNEALIVFEALFQKLIDSDLAENTELNVTWAKSSEVSA
jgi:hypothetical protein